MKYGQTDLPLGFSTSKDTFQMLPWLLGTGAGRARIEELVGKDKADTARLTDRIALAAQGNFCSKASVNISMEVRAAWRRLHGLEARFVQDVIQLRKKGQAT